MADRAAEVRQIAIRKRGVTPRLTGAPTRRRRARAKPPAAFRPLPEAPQRRGLPLPVDVLLRALLERGRPRRPADRDVRAALERRSTCGRRKARKRTPYDVLTIASIVERETRAPPSGALIAAVIYNRLDRGMPLAIDATLRYGLGIAGDAPRSSARTSAAARPTTRTASRACRRRRSRTRASPSMRAAAKPAAVDYLYYVRKPDGVHHFFTADEQEFCAKANEYGYRLLSASAARRRGAVRKRRPSRARCGRPRRPSRAGRRPGRPPRA